MPTESFTRRIKITNKKAVKILAEVLEKDGKIKVDPNVSQRIKKCTKLLKDHSSQFKVFQK